MLPVFTFDPRDYGKTPSGFDKTGPHRASFILDSLADLRQRLRDLGSDLLVRAPLLNGSLAAWRLTEACCFAIPHPLPITSRQLL